MGFGKVEVKEEISDEKLFEMKTALNDYGVEIVESNKSIILKNKGRHCIEMAYLEDKLPSSKISHYLDEKIGFRFCLNFFIIA